MTTDPAKRYQRMAWVLLGLMTLVTVGGPVGIWLALRGGPSPDWPPDRPVEWVTLLGTCALMLGLMILSVATAVASQRAASRVREQQST